jgi:hypothetical protein
MANKKPEISLLQWSEIKSPEHLEALPMARAGGKFYAW